MKIKTSTACFNTDLICTDIERIEIRLNSPALILKRKGSELIACVLQFQAALSLYQQIEEQAWFNLQPDLKGSIAGEPFDEDKAIKVQMTLHPIFLERLAPYVSNIRGAVDYLLDLGQSASTDSLLKSDSWFITSVEQKQAKKTAGYKTFWHQVEFGMLKNGLMTEDFLVNTWKFLQEKTDFDLTDLKDDMQAQLHLWNGLTQAGTGADSQATRQLLEQAFSQTAEDSAGDRAIASVSAGPSIPVRDDNRLFSTVHRFFEHAHWDFYRSDATALELVVKVKATHGEWHCLAKVDDFQEQFLFYSFFPVTIPADCRAQLAELCVRANFGTVIGNFELDFETGTLRYKTSIDVGSTLLESAAIRQLVETNLTMIDRYWPAVMQVLYGSTSPAAALQLLEQTPA